MAGCCVWPSGGARAHVAGRGRVDIRVPPGARRAALAVRLHCSPPPSSGLSTSTGSHNHPPPPQIITTTHNHHPGSRFMSCDCSVLRSNEQTRPLRFFLPVVVKSLWPLRTSNSEGGGSGAMRRAGCAGAGAGMLRVAGAARPRLKPQDHAKLQAPAQAHLRPPIVF